MIGIIYLYNGDRTEFDIQEQFPDKIYLKSLKEKIVKDGFQFTSDKGEFISINPEEVKEVVFK